MKSLYDVGREYAESDYAVFSMPGHKNRASFVLPEGAYRYDFTELSVTDDLYCSENGIKNIEITAEKLFGSYFSCLSVAGASLCVMAAMGIARKFTEKIMISRFCHSSAVNGMSIFGLTPVWLTQKRSGTAVAPLCAEEIERKIAEDSSIGAVFITTPDYYGTVTDLEGISTVCKRHKKLLIVDNSHGTHFVLGGTHPIKYADITCDSLHKTLPSLTGTALLNISKSLENKVEKDEVKDVMKRLSSTSPSYLLALSAESCINWMIKEGKSAYLKANRTALEAREKIEALGFELNCGKVDPCRICISALGFGIDGKRLYSLLLDEKVVCEMADDVFAVAILTPFNSESDLSRLINALEKIAKNGKKRPANISPLEFYIPKCAKRLAFFDGEKTEKLPLCSSYGRISAENKYIYPPSRPIVLCGEIIDEKVIDELTAAGEKTVRVVSEK
ncbi:MAG: DegT/DnrJ/EryC1/StrS family aminotransferase [Clostridia bacterium]|nr:DegT/DnrJ/EryC1/StrS family aminotransferase [Clostridia bacterium]